MKKYMLDSNVFIQANRFHYPFDIFPAFWDFLDQMNTEERVYSISAVYDEIIVGDDLLMEWVKDRKELNWFLSLDDEPTQLIYADIAEWAVNPVQGFTQTAQEIFLDIADSWLVAKAKAEGFTVVTHEKLAPGAKNRILIPNVCKAFDVEYVDTISLLRDLRARF